LLIHGLRGKFAHSNFPLLFSYYIVSSIKGNVKRMFPPGEARAAWQARGEETARGEHEGCVRED